MEREVRPERTVTLGPDGRLRIAFPYDERLVALVKGLPGRTWHNGEKFWTVPGEHVALVVELLRPEGFRFAPEVVKLYEAGRAEPPDHLTVSQLNLRARTALLSAFPSPLWVVGEVSGFNRNAHRTWVGFQLVERSPEGKAVAQVEAALGPEDRRTVEAQLRRAGDPFRLEDGVVVRVLVRVDLYPEWGQYRVLVQGIDPRYTLGEAARRREEIVRKLTAEGLIERNRSLPFPDLPLRVGLVTSLGSDAYHDVLRTLRESGYAFQVTVHGARVQGPATEASVLNALDWFRERAAEFDLVLLCRGGGSRTDLAWFDSEALGRAVALFPLPVVVGIGHEEDWSVLDHVGWREKTPTAAAQFVVAKVRDALDRVEGALGEVVARGKARVEGEREAHRRRAERLARGIRVRLEGENRELTHRARRLRRGTRAALARARELVGRLAKGLHPAAERHLGRAGEHLVQLGGAVPRQALLQLRRAGEGLEARGRRLHALDPQRVVERGYAILRSEGGRVVTDPAQAPVGSRLRAHLRRGVLLLRSEGQEGA
ncbi:MAG: exodeoxyribonuclease VII large subunit [Candidatus Bipolaricaulota bacterium]|nr:exodeoxyribonuclease VII large subunit [Candidatus Bipolaricaulota bacterium]